MNKIRFKMTDPIKFIWEAKGMKTVVMVIALGSSSSVALSCNPSPPVKTVTVKKSNIAHAELRVSGMTCVGCEVTLESALKEIEGMVKVKASHGAKSVEVDFDKTKTDLEKIRTVITEAGYLVEQ